LADQIAIIRRGKIIARGSPLALKQVLLGAGEYLVRVAAPLNGIPELPSRVELVTQGPDWFRYRTEFPEMLNSQILQALLSDGIPVVSLQEVPRSLEAVYLQVISSTDEEMLHVA
jgi:ABC-2 type transport system ATP-binding protein